MKIFLNCSVVWFCAWLFSASTALATAPAFLMPVNLQTTCTDPPHYKFSYVDLDQLLQLIEKHRGLKPSNASLDYGIMFYPEKNLSSGMMTLVARASVIFPYEAVPLNLPGNFITGSLEGADFFSPEFLSTFKQNPAQANGATQAYTFAVLYENQVQILLSAKGVLGVKVYNITVDYMISPPKTNTSKFFNLNIVADLPKFGFGEGAQFFLAIPCPPLWRE